jgi:hypothetical protein
MAEDEQAMGLGEDAELAAELIGFFASDGADHAQL